MANAELEAVSPGARDLVAFSAHTCPTFSWSSRGGASSGGASRGGDEGLTGVELRVFEAEQTDNSRSPVGPAVLEVTLAAGARSWTPAAGDCLAPGRLYAWEVSPADTPRAVSSDPFWFRVASRPSLEDVARAEAILRRRLAQSRFDRLPTGDHTRAAPPASSGATDRAERDSAGASRTVAAGTASASGMTVSGGTEVTGLRIAAGNGFDGSLEATGDLHTAGLVETSGLVLPGGASANDFLTLWSPVPGLLNLCDYRPLVEPPGFDRRRPCNDVAQNPGPQIPANGELRAGQILAEGLAVAADGDGAGLEGRGIDVPTGNWTGGGGAGFDTVGASGGDVDYDDNESPCPSGAVVIGARLFQAGGDQIGIQVKCSSG
jgi:hypothetical protein